jgi:hypothetical protein
MSLEFEKNEAEEYFQESIKDGVFRKGVEKLIGGAHELTIKGFETLYQKLKFEKPDYNVFNKNNISGFVEQIRSSKALEEDEKNVFLIHLYANNLMTSEARQLLSKVSDQKKRAALERLIDGVGSGISKARGELLEKYFQAFPSSNHFLANLIIAEYYSDRNEESFLVKMHLDRAFNAVPYNEGLLQKYSQILPDKTSISEIKKLICGDK